MLSKWKFSKDRVGRFGECLGILCLGAELAKQTQALCAPLSLTLTLLILGVCVLGSDFGGVNF